MAIPPTSLQTIALLKNRTLRAATAAARLAAAWRASASRCRAASAWRRATPRHNASRGFTHIATIVASIVMLTMVPPQSECYAVRRNTQPVATANRCAQDSGHSTPMHTNEPQGSVAARTAVYPWLSILDIERNNSAALHKRAPVKRGGREADRSVNCSDNDGALSTTEKATDQSHNRRKTKLKQLTIQVRQTVRSTTTLTKKITSASTAASSSKHHHHHHHQTQQAAAESAAAAPAASSSNSQQQYSRSRSSQQPGAACSR